MVVKFQQFVEEHEDVCVCVEGGGEERERGGERERRRERERRERGRESEGERREREREREGERAFHPVFTPEPHTHTPAPLKQQKKRKPNNTSPVFPATRCYLHTLPTICWDQKPRPSQAKGCFPMAIWWLWQTQQNLYSFPHIIYTTRRYADSVLRIVLWFLCHSAHRNIILISTL
jgi:hypothetical protein